MIHPTVSDKERVARAIPRSPEGEWRALSILLADGRIVTKVGIGDAEGLVAGWYSLQYQLAGHIVVVPSTVLDCRIDRYPYDPKDNGTAWDYIDLTHRTTRRWFATRHGKIELRASGTYSRAVGISVRYRGGRLTNDQIVLKFVRLRDDE